MAGMTTIAGRPTINVPPFMNLRSAIASLVGAQSGESVWGWYGGRLQAGSALGSCSFDAAEPGVKVHATMKREGTVDSAAVVYSGVVGGGDSGIDDARVIRAWIPKVVIVDAQGHDIVVYNRAAAVDASGSDAAAAADAGAAASAKRSEFTWSGTVTLEAIWGASHVKAGMTVYVGDVDGALITDVKVDVASETVTLSLGGEGWSRRFAGQPGKAGSASPTPSRKVNAFELRALMAGQR